MAAWFAPLLVAFVRALVRDLNDELLATVRDLDARATHAGVVPVVLVHGAVVLGQRARRVMASDHRGGQAVVRDVPVADFGVGLAHRVDAGAVDASSVSRALGTAAAAVVAVVLSIDTGTSAQHAGLAHAGAVAAGLIGPTLHRGAGIDTHHAAHAADWRAAGAGATGLRSEATGPHAHPAARHETARSGRNIAARARGSRVSHG